MSETRRKEKPRELAKKKIQAVTEEMCEPEPGTAANDFKIGYKAAARDGLNRFEQEIATRKIEQEAKLELENERTQEQLNAFEASEAEETKAPSSLSMKLNVISGKTFGMVPQGIKIQSVISEEVRDLVMCYVDDVVIATPTLADNIDRLNEVFHCMKRIGLKCKPSKCEILRDSIN